MSWQVYSETFVTTSAAGVITEWTVPSGHRAVVKSINAVNPSATAVTGSAFVHGFYVARFSLPATSGNFVITTMAVAYAGWKIGGRMDQTGGSLMISGYLFLDSSGAQGPGTAELQEGPAPYDYVDLELAAGA